MRWAPSDLEAAAGIPLTPTSSSCAPPPLRFGEMLRSGMPGDFEANDVSLQGGESRGEGGGKRGRENSCRHSLRVLSKFQIIHTSISSGNNTSLAVKAPSLPLSFPHPPLSGSSAHEARRDHGARRPL